MLLGRIIDTHGFSCKDYGAELGEIAVCRRSYCCSFFCLQNRED